MYLGVVQDSLRQLLAFCENGSVNYECISHLGESLTNRVTTTAEVNGIKQIRFYFIAIGHGFYFFLICIVSFYDERLTNFQKPYALYYCFNIVYRSLDIRNVLQWFARYYPDKPKVFY